MDGKAMSMVGKVPMDRSAGHQKGNTAIVSE
jgi:hypothetical protein